MIKAIKLFLLKRRIGYRKAIDNNRCWNCFAFNGICDRYKIAARYFFTCNHFVPKNYNRTISEKEKVEIERVKNTFETLLGGFDKLIGGKI